MMSALLNLEGLGKSWFGVPAVTDMHLQINKGSVLGIVGENGAGKSTLMNMIGGVVPPTTGKMFWQGQPYQPSSPAHATDRGIAFIHQELNLFTNLTIAENIFIDSFPRRMGLIDRHAIREKTKALLDRLNLAETPDTKVEVLAPGERQLVEIAKALHRDASLIIFDEPTTSLTARETEKLFDTINRLRKAGTTVIYISHILMDVQKLCNEIAVLRDGELVGNGPIEEFDVPTMIQTMIGRDLETVYPPSTSTPTNQVVLGLEGVSQDGVIEDVSFRVRAGETVGLFGLMGSGRTELARMIFGVDPVGSGQITINGVPAGETTRDRIDQGMAFVTENRREEGLMMDATIADNLSLVAIEQFGRKPFSLLDTASVAQRTEAIRSDVTIKAQNIATQAARSLSGGNQQKVVIGKWLMRQPRLFILDEPTRGVDVGAKHEIYTLIDRLAASGSAILMISSELDELIGTCDGIVVMAQGEVSGRFERREFDETNIISAAFREMVA